MANSANLTAQLSETTGKLVTLASAEAAVAAAEQANGLPALRTAVASARTALASDLESNWGLLAAEANAIAFAITPSATGDILGRISTAAATLQDS